ncbi:MAG: DUF1189 family protein [Verrucomicrobiae bacterium]|nr:DUF1189 family protein [Verrucomicrobiae bacterium]
MKTFAFIFWNAIRGFASYRSIFRLPSRVAVTYWIVFCFAIVGISLFIAYLEALAELPRTTSEMAQRLPPFSFQGGRLHAEVPTPAYSQTNVYPGHIEQVVLDPDHKITGPPSTMTNGFMRIGLDKIEMWRVPNEPPAEVLIKNLPDGKVDEAYLLRHFRDAIHILTPVLWIVLSLFACVVGLLQALFFTSLVAFLEKSRGLFTYSQLLNISIFALTPASVFLAVYKIWDLEEFPYPYFYLFAYIIYHVLGTQACRDSLTPKGPARYVDQEW